MRWIIVIVLMLVTLVGVLAITGGGSPPDYAALAQPTIDAANRSTTDDERLTAILEAHSATKAIVEAIDSVDDAAEAKPHLLAIASIAKDFDERMKRRPDERGRLLTLREAECQHAAIEIAQVLTSLAFRPRTMTMLIEPLDLLASTLQP